MRAVSRCGRGARWWGVLACALGWALGAEAVVVHVVEQKQVGGTVTELSDRTVDTGTTYTTTNAPKVAGYLFTQWTADTHQAIDTRDAWGRALEAVSFTVYENTTLTAEYLSEEEDSDGDGMADGYEIYWYGDLNETPDGDTDGDGLSFAEEVRRGSNPLIPDTFVMELTMVGGTVTVLSDRTVNTGITYTSANAPQVAGYLFTQWTADTHQAIDTRDAWGRALEAGSFTVDESARLTAEYLSEGEDMDGDGLADGYEIYWYGDLDETPDGDTDGDGVSFAEEVRRGANPLFPDRHLPGLVAWGGSETVEYNPSQWEPPPLPPPPPMATYIIRSEPEGRLFETITREVDPGTVITTASFSPATSVFAEWRVNGQRMQDAWGRALDAVTFVATTTEVTEAVAWCAEDVIARHGMYWYNDAGISADSDTDGDGYTLAQEVAGGANPLFPEHHLPGFVVFGDSGLVEYNPSQWEPPPPPPPPPMATYIIRSEPEGRLFATITAEVDPGTVITTANYSPATSVFAEWRVNGQRMQDAWGRALDAVTFVATTTEVAEAVAWCAEDVIARQGVYWYNEAGISADSDTDGDGYTLAQEIARGSNPLFSEQHLPGFVVRASSATIEVDLQPFEQLRTALVEGVAEEVFTSPVAGNEGEAWAFGHDLSPAVADLNRDGLFDLVLVSMDGVRVLMNKGAVGSPDFEEVADPFDGLAASFASADAATRVIAGGEGGVYLAGSSIRFFAADGSAAVETALSGVPAWRNGELYAFDPATGTVTTTNGTLSLDTPVIRGLSLAVADATQDGRLDLLASDDEGRVWLYRGNADGSFTLLHKVWGGSYGGFAEGLKIAGVDWDDDGDLDALGGTSEGRLMLLRDPRIGRPANARIFAGLNSVVLSWEPNTQSRVRGYRVYRAPGTAAEAENATFEKLTSPWTPLPTYRDLPPTIRDWGYRITTVSRFYTAGNSTPTETESPPTDLLEATLGGVTLALRDAACFAGEEVEMGLSINNSLGLAADGLELVIEYDATLLAPVSAVPAGLGAALALESTFDANRWTICSTGGEVAAGEGTLFVLRFSALDGVEGEASVSLVSAFLRATSGQAATAPTPVSGTVSIQLRAPTEPVDDPLIVVPWSKGDVDGNGRLERADLERLRVLLDYAGYSGHGGNGNGHGGPGQHVSVAMEQELRAGDMNGNGKLEEGDYQLLYKYLRERGAL